MQQLEFVPPKRELIAQLKVALSLRRGDRWLTIQLVVYVVATTVFGLAIMLISVYPNIEMASRDRVAARSFQLDYETPTETSDREQFLVLDNVITLGDRSLSLILFYGRSTAELLPPGVSKFPNQGEAIVSPSLARECRLSEECPISEEIIGTIDREGLANPNEWFAYVAPNVDTPPSRAMAVLGIGTELGLPSKNRVAPIGFSLFVLAPAAALMFVALRYDARRNVRRVLTLRTLGMSRLATAINLASQAILGAVLGSAIALVMYPQLTKLASALPIVSTSYEPHDLAIGPLKNVGIAMLVVLVSVIGSILGSARYLTREALGGRPERGSMRIIINVSSSLALIAGSAILIERSLSLQHNPRGGASAPLVLLGVVLTAVGFMGGAAPLAALIPRIVPVSAGHAQIGLGFRRVQYWAAAATRSSGPVALICFLAGIIPAVSTLHDSGPAAVFRDDATATTLFATRDGFKTTIQAPMLAGVAHDVVNEEDVIIDETIQGRALIGSCTELEHLFQAEITECNGTVQLLKLDTGYLATAGELANVSKVPTHLRLNGESHEISPTVASINVSTDLPFPEFLFVLPPSIDRGPTPPETSRLLGRVTATKAAYGNLALEVSRLDPATNLELPSVSPPPVLGIMRWLTLGSLVGGTMALIAMTMTVLDLRARQARGYAMLQVLGANRAGAVSHVVALIFPAIINISIAVIISVFAGAGYIQDFGQLPSWQNYLWILLTGVAFSSIMATLTIPRRLKAETVSSLIHAE